MTVGLWVVAPAGRIVSGSAFAPGWVERFDADAFDGLGDLTVTTDVGKALAFDHATAALEFWQQTSKVRPVRDDGKPNRPLTAFTVEVRRL